MDPDTGFAAEAGFYGIYRGLLPRIASSDIRLSPDSSGSGSMTEGGGNMRAGSLAGLAITRAQESHSTLLGEMRTGGDSRLNGYHR
ncbi:hypothetical protein KCP76_25795 [Salmonella enterica subsp. enterica serovar Weltevreden]|nr:hypothetical protein KCP76_25795 [Salmonella enterica subsp. enterica serovar Weltevreden]